MAPSSKIAPITKNMTFHEILEKYPQTVSVFFKYQLHCIGCPMSAGETIEQGARSHKINVEKMLSELNKAAAKKSKN